MVWPEEVQLEKCTEENELIKQWKVIAGQDIPDRERISVILKEIIDQGNRWEKSMQKRIFPGRRYWKIRTGC